MAALRAALAVSLLCACDALVVAGGRAPPHVVAVPTRSRRLQMLRDDYDLIIVGGGPVGVTAAMRASSLGYNAILIDATPPRQFQFTGPTGLYSKALRDSALRIDVPVLRSMGIGDEAIWEQLRTFVNKILRKSGENNVRAPPLASTRSQRRRTGSAAHPYRGLRGAPRTAHRRWGRSVCLVCPTCAAKGGCSRARRPTG
jgi:glycine/D-amino acid oxidase-like deaminating enzyme